MGEGQVPKGRGCMLFVSYARGASVFRHRKRCVDSCGSRRSMRPLFLAFPYKRDANRTVVIDARRLPIRRDVQISAVEGNEADLLRTGPRNVGSGIDRGDPSIAL